MALFPSLDYFVSDAVMSPADRLPMSVTRAAAADDKAVEVTERLILLPHFHMFQGQPFRRASSEAREAWRSSIGVPPHVTLFACFNQAKKIGNAGARRQRA